MVVEYDWKHIRVLTKSIYVNKTNIFIENPYFEQDKQTKKIHKPNFIATQLTDICKPCESGRYRSEENYTLYVYDCEKQEACKIKYEYGG